MAINFLQHLSFGSGGSTHKVVSTATGAEREAAERVLNQVLTELPDMLGAAVIQVPSGRALATYTTSREFNVAKTAAYQAEVVKQKRQALAALQLPDEHIEDVVITLSNQMHLLRLFADGEWLLYVAVDCRDTNLALARAVMQACVE